MKRQKSSNSPIGLRQQYPSNLYKSLHSSISNQPNTIIEILQKFTPIQQCPYHNQQIQFCCFDCKQMCCCSKCLLKDKHQTHDVKNIHRGYCMVEALLNQFTVKLTAKAELYSLWHQKISIGKSQLIQDVVQLKKMVNARFSQLKDILQKKNYQVLEQIQHLKDQKQEYLSQYLTQLRNKIKLNHDSQSIVTANIQELSEPSLCKYYSQMKQHLQMLVSQDIEDQLKSLIVRPKYVLNNNKIESAKSILQQMSNIYYVQTQKIKKTKYRAHFNIPATLHQQQPNSRSMVNNKSIRDSYHSPQSATPKNISQFMKDYDYYSKVRPSFGNLITKNDSKKTLKLFSATSSPFKDKKQSPLHYLQLQKKCFIKGKQNQ